MTFTSKDEALAINLKGNVWLLALLQGQGLVATLYAHPRIRISFLIITQQYVYSVDHGQEIREVKYLYPMQHIPVILYHKVLGSE